MIKRECLNLFQEEFEDTKGGMDKTKILITPFVSLNLFLSIELIKMFNNLP
jgi:hypothetical protein